MKIEYANYHSWYKSIEKDPFVHYGKNDCKRIKKSLKIAKEKNIHWLIEEARDAFFDWFQPMYNKSIQAKNNPRLFDTKATTIGKEIVKFPYYTLTLFEDNIPIGGSIFSDRGEHYSIAYRIYNRNWKKKLPGTTPAILGEFILDEFSYTNNKKSLIHGQDRNPYGINSAMGLSIFKLSVGCKARLPKKFEVATIDTDSVKQDVLILNYPTDNCLEINEATLVSSKENLSKYEQIFKYEDRISIKTLIR